jgi:RNA-directed DNA polymerase
MVICNEAHRTFVYAERLLTFNAIIQINTDVKYFLFRSFLLYYIYMTLTNNWNKINWKKCAVRLSALQYEILIAFREGNMKLVTKLQHELTRSFAARAMAVRKVVSNKGGKTAGIDKVIWDSKELRFQAIGKLKNLSQYEASPVRRVYIPKSFGQVRPLGIPTMFDRAVQVLYMFSLDPITEETACKHSYGYRLHRSVKDCAVYLWLVIASPTATRRFVLEADIKGFFPSVCHRWLLENVPMDKRILGEFLKAGFMEGASFHKTVDGFPQGSPISPSLANYTLNGLEDLLVNKGFLMTRYADDFVVLGKSVEELRDVARPVTEQFLSLRGLELHPEKTGICTIKDGFDFLGYHFREYPNVGRAKGNKEGIFLVTPSSGKLISFCKELRVLIKNYNGKSLYELTLKLNRKLRGWAEHYRTVTSKKAFKTVTYHLWHAWKRKLVRRHRTRSWRWIEKKYFMRRKGNKWIFVAGKGSAKEVALFQISYVEIKRHSIRSSANAYDVEVNECFVKTNAAHSRTKLLQSNQQDYLSKVQKGKCTACGESLFNGEDIIVLKESSSTLRKGRPPKFMGKLVHRICGSQLRALSKKDQ